MPDALLAFLGSGYTLTSLNLSWTGRERECGGGKEGINIENTMGAL
jgi:hypothetical protein